jgi:hypothetical protein
MRTILKIQTGQRPQQDKSDCRKCRGKLKGLQPRGIQPQFHTYPKNQKFRWNSGGQARNMRRNEIRSRICSARPQTRGNPKLRLRLSKPGDQQPSSELWLARSSTHGFPKPVRIHDTQILQGYPGTQHSPSAIQGLYQTRTKAPDLISKTGWNPWADLHCKLCVAKPARQTTPGIQASPLSNGFNAPEPRGRKRHRKIAG